MTPDPLNIQGKLSFLLFLCVKGEGNVPPSVDVEQTPTQTTLGQFPLGGER